MNPIGSDYGDESDGNERTTRKEEDFQNKVHTQEVKLLTMTLSRISPEVSALVGFF